MSGTRRYRGVIVLADRSDCWLVVGAGPSGLSVTRAMSVAGMTFEGVEADAQVGGLWNWDNPGGGIYQSAHFISSSARSGWADMPMPDHYPDYPRWWEIRDYIHAWAAKHDLAKHFEFGVRVKDAVPVETDDGECWDVTLNDGEQRRYRGVVACPGFQRVPQMPTYPGSFAGEQRHSQTYKRSSEFDGKRVMVVGAGNSAVDIAVDAAIAGTEAFISTRRGYWFCPKLIGGVPFDHYAINSVSSQERLRDFLAIRVGDVAEVGFGEPDHLPLEHHPILNDQVLHHLAHGDLVAKPEIKRLDGLTVHFVDGTHVDVDLIIWATGYTDEIPFVSSEHCTLSSTDEHNDLYLWMFHRRHPHLAVLGPANLAAGGYWGLAAAADAIVNHLSDEEQRPEKWHEFRDLIQGPEPDLSGGYEYHQKPRHLNYVNAAALETYAEELNERFGWGPLATPADYVAPELIDIDDWLDNPRPVARPPHGSLTPVKYDPRDVIGNLTPTASSSPGS